MQLFNKAMSMTVNKFLVSNYHFTSRLPSGTLSGCGQDLYLKRNYHSGVLVLPPLYGIP